MGQIIVEIPFEVNRTYRITETQAAVELLNELNALADTSLREVNPKQSKTPAIILPTESHNTKDSAAVLGIWADRPETGEEIARKIRQANRKTT